MVIYGKKLVLAFVMAHLSDQVSQKLSSQVLKALQFQMF